MGFTLPENDGQITVGPGNLIFYRGSSPARARLKESPPVNRCLICSEAKEK